MKQDATQHDCPDCHSTVSRRSFLGTTAGAAAVVGSLPLLAQAAPSRKSAAETAVARLYKSLSSEQKKVVALPFSDSRRTKINANWHITEAKIGSFFNKEQQATITEIVKGVTSEDGFERFQQQMKEDHGGIGRYSIALFGNPADKQFEFELTGRHLTLRADGDTIEGVAFGGPIVYGHSKKGNSKQNLFSYQTKRANEVFAALNGKQRAKALVDKAPKETAVLIREDVSALPGIAGSDLSGDQKELVTAVLRDIMKPYRTEDVDEVMEIVKAGGGVDKLQIAFYKSGDLDKDEKWDVWRLEGPTLVCHFRGAPHVHAYINVAKRG
jgi:hypothetical protein